MRSATADGASDEVRINVGGSVFSSSRRTLLSVTDSFFSVLLSGRHGVRLDDSGAYFIDRSPEVFAAVLNYLRTGAMQSWPEPDRDV